MTFAVGLIVWPCLFVLLAGAATSLRRSWVEANQNIRTIRVGAL